MTCQELFMVGFALKIILHYCFQHPEHTQYTSVFRGFLFSKTMIFLTNTCNCVCQIQFWGEELSPPSFRTPYWLFAAILLELLIDFLYCFFHFIDSNWIFGHSLKNVVFLNFLKILKFLGANLWKEN